MSGRIKSKLTYANVMATVAVFIAFGGGAYAVSTAPPNSVVSRSIKDGQVKQSDIGANAVTSSKVGKDSLAGKDIADQSGVDTCTHGTVRLGEMCFETSSSAPQNWYQAVGDCSGKGLRLPSYSEAIELAVQYDLPGVGDQELFWTGDHWYEGNLERSWGVDDGASTLDSSTASTYKTVCVTTPTN